jgi:hypothetical protein
VYSSVADVDKLGNYVQLNKAPFTGDIRYAVEGDVLCPKAYPVPQSLIYQGVPLATDLVQTAFFGYVDSSDDGVAPTNTDLDYGAGTGRPWAWPTLIRVTMSLTDPNNPGIEETFQFIFPTPGNPL